MKRLLLSLALAATASLPIAASAQQAPANPPTAAERQGPMMRADFTQMRKMHEQFRSQVLGALTPAHRALLASVAGNLAVAAHPDYRAAAAQLDAALSPGEKSAIFAAAKQMRAQMKSMMASMPKRPWPNASGAPRHHGNRKPHHAPSAGAILLGLAGGHGMMGGWHGGPPPQHP